MSDPVSQTTAVKTIQRECGNVILLTLGDREHVLDVREAQRLGNSLVNEAFSASENMALRSSWMRTRDMLREIFENPDDCDVRARVQEMLKDE